MIELNKIYNQDCIEGLKTLPDNCIDCCVTSPPYFGLRDYGHTEQIGLEETPELYVAKMVEVFTEVKRVLKKEGVMFLNLGDSYFGSGKGGNPEGSKWSGFISRQERKMPSKSASAKRVKPYDTSGKEPVNYQDRDCLCGSLCGVCRKAYQIGKSHKDYLHDPTQVVSPSLPIHEHKEFENGHSPTSDSFQQVSHNSNAIQDSKNNLTHESGQHPSFPASMPVESFLPQQENSPLLDNFSSCLLCGCSFVNSAQASVDRSACTCDIQENGHPLNQNKPDIFSSHTAYKQYTKLKPKDLIGIPWLVAFALRESGWYLRQDIIWHKPNPMPESVTDRCTKAHEYIFLMSKSAKYYYDAEAIGPKILEDTLERYKRGWNGNGERGFPNGPQNHIQNFMDPDNEKRGWANKKSVWTVNTYPYAEAHFATFPEDLIVDMIKAGCPEGGTILDPFMGAGTTALVAAKLNRNFIGFELNAEYLKIAKKRLEKHLGFFNPAYQ